MKSKKFVTRKALKEKSKQQDAKSPNRWWHEIELKCCICKRHFTVTTTNVGLYTTEVKKNIKCVFCKED
jgi:hypothetical protein